MTTDAQREAFNTYLTENNLNSMLSISSSATITQDNTLKYERIDKYSVVVLSGEELKRLNAFCKLHNIALQEEPGQVIMYLLISYFYVCAK